MNNSMKTPLIRLAKREGMDKRTVWAIRVGSILLALLLGALVIAISGVNPFKAYGTIITGALGKKTAIRQTVKIAVPLLGCALAIAPCFKMRFWNIGAEGQITAGAIAASYFALYWVGKVPSAVLLLIMGAAGAVAGGIWALIPAFFKARWNTNETLFTSSAWSAGCRAARGRVVPALRSSPCSISPLGCRRFSASTAAGSLCWCWWW